MSALSIPRGEHCDVVVASEDGMAIVWQFYVQALDVGFRVLVDGVESPTFSKRVDTLDGMVDGTLEHGGDARLVCLQWDNSYSRLRAKDVLYRVMAVPTATLHVAREAANEYQIKYNHPVHNSSSTRHLDRPSTIMPSLPEGHDTSSMHDALAQRLERAVVDTVAVFMTQPDTPLHAGSARPLILALEAILRHGVKPTSKMASCPPEEFYFGFLVETRNVLRDDAGVVSDAELFAPPLFMRYLGWGRARAYLCFALNRHMLHRALEVAVFNLIKRRSVVARYYDPSRALLAHYDTAQRTLACLTALYGVSFNLTPLQDDFASTAATFPPNLYQSHASDAFVTSRQLLSIGGDVAFYQGTTTHMDEFKAIQDCTPARYLCLATPPVQVTIPRGSRVCIPLHMDDPTTLVAVVQFQVTRHSIGVGFTTNPIKELVDPLQPVEGDAWVELTLRLERPIPQLQLVLDNSHSMLRTKAVTYRLVVTSRERYASAWACCAEVAHVICWKQVIHRSLEWSSKHMEAMLHEEQQWLRPRSPPPPSSSTTLTESVTSWLGSVLVPDEPACAQCTEPISLFRRHQSCSICLKGCCVACTRHLWASKPVCDRCYLRQLDIRVR
ncbi:hypothetical protein DYB26_012627, partial [Aphanomyces astaci]